jgi:hypothetical protein
MLGSSIMWVMPDFARESRIKQTPLARIGRGVGSGNTRLSLHFDQITTFNGSGHRLGAVLDYQFF